MRAGVGVRGVVVSWVRFVPSGRHQAEIGPGRARCPTLKTIVSRFAIDLIKRSPPAVIVAIICSSP
jgi:hypothetical protein